ncbi:MAG: hypothetical protein ACOZBW_08260 [Thermodesulfobacteriota bacterium]
MPDSSEKAPECFSRLDTVFPMGADGLRHTPDTCMACAWKTACLRAAIKSKDGLVLDEEKVDRAYASGNMGFFERWSKRKTLKRRQGEGS